MNVRSQESSLTHRQKVKEESRRAILEAAESVFSAKGFHDASLTLIARQAGFAVGTLYLYFEDKADLYGSLLLEKMKQMVGEFEEALTSSKSASESLRAAVHSQFAFHDANRTFFEIFLHQHQIQTSPLHSEHWKEMEALKARILKRIEACVKRGQSAGDIKPGSSRLYAVAFLGVTLQMIRQWIREGNPSRLADCADFAADCFLKGASR
jgi:AcrR family transcriptional regulator